MSLKDKLIGIIYLNYCFADGKRGDVFYDREIPKNNKEFWNLKNFVQDNGVIWNENNKILERNFTWRKKTLSSTPIINTSDVFVSLYYEQNDSK